jgi:hypothetical protein
MTGWPCPLVAVLHLDAPSYAEEFLRCGLLLDAGLLDEEDERRRAAIHDGQLGRIDVDIRVVDAEPPQRGHQVLDGVDLHAALDRAGTPRRCPPVRAAV